MNFLSFQFVIFLLVIILLFYLLPCRYRKFLLLAASYFFYASWNVPFIGLIILTTSVDYSMSRIIHHSPSALARKSALFSGLAVNLLVLIIFKYGNFLMDSSYSLSHWLHFEPFWPKAMQIILPLGISFYTFEAISYMVDVYRGEKPAKSWWDYNFYIMYFPHLISGPIIRYKELSSQFNEPLQKPVRARWILGLKLVILGYLFKVLIADSVAPLSDALFNQHQSATVLATYIGVLAFTAQIYFDFMGYTHIARGVSLFFNIELPLNFNHPYLATNISNFWERWHISLSRWIRDYLYFPLGGSLNGLFCTIFNLLITMTICGAWHGAGWNYILWGAYHGVCLAGYHCYRRLKNNLLSSQQNEQLGASLGYRTASMLFTFIVVVIGWVFFRATKIEDAIAILKKLFRFPELLSQLGAAASVQNYHELGLAAAIIVCCFGGIVAVRLTSKIYNDLPLWLKGQVAAMSIFLAIVVMVLKSLSNPTNIPFIYFQF